VGLKREYSKEQLPQQKKEKTEATPPRWCLEITPHLITKHPT